MKTQFYTASDEIKSNVFVVKRSKAQRRDPWRVWIATVEPKGALVSSGGKMALLIISSPIFLLPHRSNK